MIFIIYGGIMNFCGTYNAKFIYKGTGIKLAVLKALLYNRVPYDIMHAATAALCVFFNRRTIP